MVSLGNGFWINKKYITKIEDIKDANRYLKMIKNKGFQDRIINLSGIQKSETCIFTKEHFVFLVPFKKENIKKRVINGEDIDQTLKCGNGNWIIGDNVILVLSTKKSIATKVSDVCKEIGLILDFTQGKKAKSYVLTKDFICIRSPLNSNTTAGHGRVVEKNKKEKITQKEETK